MKISKLLNKKYLSIIFIISLFSLCSQAEDQPIDIWNIEKNEVENETEKKKFSEKLILILGNEIIDIYFTSNIVIKALENRSKIYLKYKKKESLFTLLKKVKNTKLKFIK